jgi:hypothetical protein
MLKKLRTEMMKGTALANTLGGGSGGGEESQPQPQQHQAVLSPRQKESPRPPPQRPHVPKIFSQFGRQAESVSSGSPSPLGSPADADASLDEPDICAVYSHFADENRDRLSQVSFCFPPLYSLFSLSVSLLRFFFTLSESFLSEFLSEILSFLPLISYLSQILKHLQKYEKLVQQASVELRKAGEVSLSLSLSLSSSLHLPHSSPSLSSH